MIQIRSALVLSFAIWTGANTVVAQEAPASTEPQYVDQFFSKSSDGSLVPLERQTMQHQMKDHNYFVKVKVESVNVIPSQQSNVRLQPTAHFIVRMETGDRDPSTLIHLVQLTQGKGERDLVKGGKSGYIFAGGKNENATAEIPVTATKFGAHSLEVVPAQPLAPGEYAYVTMFNKADCFGVDAK